MERRVREYRVVGHCKDGDIIHVAPLTILRAKTLQIGRSIRMSVYEAQISGGDWARVDAVLNSMPNASQRNGAIGGRHKPTTLFHRPMPVQKSRVSEKLRRHS